MFRKIIALTVAVFSISVTDLWAQNVGDGLQPEPNQSTTRVGTRGANWLEIPVGARAQALGGSGAVGKLRRRVQLHRYVCRGGRLASILRCGRTAG
jgi:hypothetical protein